MSPESVPLVFKAMFRVNMGLLNKKDFIHAIENTYLGLIRHKIYNDGNVTDVCMWSSCSMEKKYYLQLETIDNDDHGTLGTFVGMLTDSRSFVSYTRHEYFRRILCNLLGKWVEDGEYPKDFDALEKIVKGICYNNAKEYFGFDNIKF